MAYKAEYIWIDGTEPTARLRSKTKILDRRHGAPDLGLRRLEHQPGARQQLRLRAPAGVLVPGPDPRRRRRARDVRGAAPRHDAARHEHAGRCCARSPRSSRDQEPLFGIEQEYTFFKDGRPLGFPPNGFPAPQAFYYCGVGADEVFGRDVVEAHLEACLEAGLGISGINAEVMPGQWEFQVGPLSPLDVSDQLWVARWLLYRVAEDFGVSATLDPKPVKGDWNGAGAHTNFSTNAMRESYDPIIAACEALGNAGAGARRELRRRHRAPAHRAVTRPHRGRSSATACPNRGASVRIPWQVEIDKKGYIEDRRPNANMDPYVVTRLITETVLQRAGRSSSSCTRRRARCRGQDSPGRWPGALRTVSITERR